MRFVRRTGTRGRLLSMISSKILRERNEDFTESQIRFRMQNDIFELQENMYKLRGTVTALKLEIFNLRRLLKVDD